MTPGPITDAAGDAQYCKMARNLLRSYRRFFECSRNKLGRMLYTEK